MPSNLTLSVDHEEVAVGHPFTLSGELTHLIWSHGLISVGWGGKSVSIQKLVKGAWMEQNVVTTSNTYGSVGTFSWTPPELWASEGAKWRAEYKPGWFEPLPLGGGPATSSAVHVKIGCPSQSISFFSSDFLLMKVTCATDVKCVWARIYLHGTSSERLLDQSVSLFLWENGKQIRSFSDGSYASYRATSGGTVSITYYPTISSGTVMVQFKYLGDSGNPELTGCVSDSRSIEWP